MNSQSPDRNENQLCDLCLQRNIHNDWVSPEFQLKEICEPETIKVGAKLNLKSENKY